MAKQEEKNVSAFEDSEAIVDGYNKFENWAKKNKNPLLLGALALAIGITAIVYFNISGREEQDKALTKLYPAEHYFGLAADPKLTDAERDSLNSIALEGDDEGTVMGFRSIARKYEGTKAGNLANFYIGAIELQSRNFEEAIAALKKFEADDLLLQPRAYEMMGDSYMELEDYTQASKYYKDASDYKPNKEFTPFRLYKLAASYEAQDMYAEAVIEYDKIIKQYPQSSLLPDAKKYREIAQGKAQ